MCGRRRSICAGWGGVRKERELRRLRSIVFRLASGNHLARYGTLMHETKSVWTTKRWLLTALMLSLTVGGQLRGQTEKDPHRPACTSAGCRKIKSFLKAHYCGESSFGNGPDDGCEIRVPKKLGIGFKVTAGFDCKWVDGARNCQQHGQPSSEVRNILIGELRKLGLVAKA